MVKRFFLFFSLIFVLSLGFWWENKYFSIKSEWYWTGGNKVDVYWKWDEKIRDVSLLVWNSKLELVWKKWENIYSFKIRTNLNISNLLTKLKIDWKEYFWPTWPYFLWLRLIDLTGWNSVKVNWKFTGSCVLHLSNWASLSMSKKEDGWYVTVPKVIKDFINGWYVVCDDLASNYVYFKIYPSPKIIYIIGKDNKLKVGGKIVIKWKYFKVSADDKIKIYLENDDITDDCIVSEEEIVCELPKKNLFNIPIKVVRNWFESNSVNISVYTSPVIKNVNFEYWNGKSTIKIYGDFPYYLWDLQVDFEWHNLDIVQTWSNFIRVLLPSAEKEKNGNFSCPYVLKPGFLKVKVGNVYSNSYFVYTNNFPKITYVDIPQCNSEWCFIKVYITEKEKVKVYLNGREASIYGQLLNLVRIKTDNLVKKWNIYIVNDNCLRSYDYVFDFSEYRNPKIFYIKSNYKFKPSSQIEIVGDKLWRDWWTGDMEVKLLANPDNAIVKDSVRIWYNSIKAEVSYNVLKWQKVTVKVQNRNWTSNEAVFIVWNKDKYIASPYIYNVIYEDWWAGGKEAKIEWVGFSDICSKNQIIFWWRVVYPNDCSYSWLKFSLPKDTVWDTIQVKVPLSDSDWLSSNIVKLDWKLWGFVPDDWKVKFLSSENWYITVNLSTNKLDQQIHFKVVNHNVPVFIPKLKIKLKTEYDILPVENVILSINDNENLYFYNKFQKKVYQTSQKNYGFVKKTKDGYEIVFNNIYIPYSLDPIDFTLKFKIYKFVKENWKFVFEIPTQRILYFNIFSDNEKPNYIKIKSVQLATVNLFKTDLICFDSDKNYSNCAYVLKWWEKDRKKDEKKKVDNTNDKKTNNKSVTSKFSKDSSIYDRVAKKLNKNLVVRLNNILYNWVNKMKRKYPLNPYLRKMKAYVVLMKKVELNDYNNKLKYAKYLIWFVKYYKKFKISIKN